MAREMKDSGIAWIGEIPVEWEVRKVKHYYKMVTGFTPDTKKVEYYDDVEGYDWVNISDIVDGTIITQTKKKISQLYVDTYKPEQIPQGALMYSFKLSVGQTAFAGKPLYTNEAIASFLPRVGVDIRFLRYSSTLIAENAEVNIYNARILNRERINNAYIVYPPIEEQHRIASFLDTECSCIDSVIEQTRASIEEYKKLKQSVITQAVTKGIRPNRKMKNSGIEWIGEMCADWPLTRIKVGVSKVGSGKTPSGGAESYSEEGILFLRSQNVYDTGLLLENPTYITEEIDKDMKNTRVQPNDVLLNITGASIGRSCIFPAHLGRANVNQHVSIIRVIESVIIPEFMHYYWLSKLGYMSIHLYQTGGNREGMTADAIKNLPIPLPCINEQREIVNYLDGKCVEIDTLVAKKEQFLSELESYKKSLIFEYVTGKKEVPV